VQTRLTQADETVLAFARAVLPNGLSTSDDILTLAGAIHGRVAYEPGTTDVTTAANQVLALGHGVCQDHAHLFLACVRGLNVPARYVSGYLYTTAEHAASHAWADVWLPDLGWTSVDITNSQFASECHCRLAVGRDYDSASPVRGVRTGGGEESMEISVQVQAGAQQ
jgi:transglutaminase-like putative cysteine protease